MPTEIRHIIFKREELLTALTEYRARLGLPLAPAPTVTLDIVSGPELLITLELRSNDGKKPQQVTFEAEEIGAALIMFCINMKIPLPATSATKKVQMFGDSLGLVILKNLTDHQIEIITKQVEAI
jgi:hypothetical protein